MHGITYKYDINPTNSTVTVRPTMRSLAQITFWSVAPLMAIVGVVELVGWASDRRSEYVPDDASTLYDE